MGFYRCECGKIHMISVMVDFCPRCGIDLRYAMFRSGMNRMSRWNGQKYIAVKS